MQPRNILRRLGRSITTRLRHTAPAAEEPVIVPGPDGDNVPAAEEIANAAEKHERARKLYNEGERGKKDARKVLHRAPTGVYGSWSISWVQPNAREWDRDAIKEVFRELGREIPVKAAAPRLKLTRVVAEPVTPEPAPGAVAEPVTAENGVHQFRRRVAVGQAKPSGLAA